MCVLRVFLPLIYRRYFHVNPGIISFIFILHGIEADSRTTFNLLMSVASYLSVQKSGVLRWVGMIWFNIVFSLRHDLIGRLVEV